MTFVRVRNGIKYFCSLVKFYSIMAIFFNKKLAQFFCKFLLSSEVFKRFPVKNDAILQKINQNFHSSFSKLPQSDLEINYNAMHLIKLLHTNKFLCNANTYQSVVKQNISSESCPPTEKKTEKPPPGRHQFHKDVEDVINEQISVELHGAFSYLSMACFFGRTEIALPGCQGFFMDMHKEEHEHAAIFINYLLMRGGHVKLTDIKMMDNHDWKNVVNAFQASLELEKAVKEKLICVFEAAEKHNDLQTMDMVSTDFMEEQNRSICEMARLLNRAKMTENPTGEYLFDQMLFDSYVKNSDGNLMYKKAVDKPGENKVYK